MSTFVPVTVILPTHDHASTLEFSVRSILNQSFQDLELVIIGDGIGDDSRSIIKFFLDQDKRVRLLDKQKSIRHGELIRDLVIRESNSKYIAYHGDDDLMLPNHLETMLEEIGDSDFIHPLPIQVGADGILNYLPADLSNQESIKWHLSEKNQNAVSLTGVVHTRESYLQLPIGWREAPKEIPSDLYMWKQYFSLTGFRGKTSTISTTIKLDASFRKEMSVVERNAEINDWWMRICEPDFQKKWERLTNEAVQRLAVQQFIAKQMTDTEYLRIVNEITSSTIWRLTKPIRIFINKLKSLTN